MKQAMYAIALGIVLVFSILASTMIESRTNRENNLTQAVRHASKSVVQSVLEEQAYTVDSDEQLVAAFVQELCNNLISNSEMTYDESTGTWVGTNGNDNTVPDPNLRLTIEVVEADFVKGLLCVHVVQEYTNPIGTISTCEASTTIIFDEAQTHEQYTIQYYNANGVIVASYIVKEGDDWPEPSQTIKDAYKITKWGSSIGGDGTDFSTLNIPTKDGLKYVPYANTSINMNSYINSGFYDPSTRTMKIYGNYNGS